MSTTSHDRPGQGIDPEDHFAVTEATFSVIVSYVSAVDVAYVTAVDVAYVTAVDVAYVSAVDVAYVSAVDVTVRPSFATRWASAPSIA